MTKTYQIARVGISLGVVVLAFSGAVSAVSSGSITADPMEPGESSKHTVTVTVDGGQVGPFRGLEIDYSGSGANPGQLQPAGVTIGIDRGDDAPGGTVDEDISADLQEVSASSEGRLTVTLGGSNIIEAGDEIVAQFVYVQNPATAGDYWTPIDFNPKVREGTTDALLQVGSNRARVLIDDQTTTGETVTVQSATLPSGGFLVLHEQQALGTGADDPAAITDASVVGASTYLSAGTHEDVEIELTASVKNHEEYVAMAVKDDGNEAYETAADDPYLVRGNPIWEPASFTVREPTSTATATQTATAMPENGEETETATARETATDEPTETPAESPGFGATLAVLSLLGAVLIAGRRRNR